ncbi:hypothetical protein D0862_14245 [Hortaea werneckii]|uniref:Uncharacterized protein n=1 Tax=Hortaea werneckii TaxID=91943 RepID=A0A3M7EC91_HORWE|nr:hypothetical protein D0862_14245 [Hortaea werneckii]
MLSVAMPSTKALLQRMLQTQSQILTRLDTLDERLDNLTASHDQLSDDVCDARKAQHDVAMEVHSLRTYVYNPASARLVNTTELLEMILLEVVDLRSDVVEDPCDEPCNKYHYGRVGRARHCGKFDDQAYHRYLDREVAKASEQARRLRTLLLSRRVSRRFRETIDCSSKLQQALFFTPDPPAGATARINWLYLTSQVCHKLVVRGNANQKDSICAHLVPETSNGAGGCEHVTYESWGCGVRSPSPGNYVLQLIQGMRRGCTCAGRGGCDIRASSTSSSWMDMQFSQPPLEVEWMVQSRLTWDLDLLPPTRPTTISSLFSDV